MKKLLVGMIAVCVSTASFATYKQNVSLCLDVKGNTSGALFNSSFVSSDWFDFGNRVADVQNGVSCVQHTYGFGPKNIRVRLKVLGRDHADNIAILPDGSCQMNKKQAGIMESGYVKTNTPVERYTVSLVQAPPMNGYKYAFNMHCSHSDATPAVLTPPN